MAEFYSARGWEIPPLPWTNLSPPFSPENALLQVHARGNLSIAERDALLRQVEERILSLHAETGELHAIYARSVATSGSQRDEPEDLIGTIQIEFTDWDRRRPADAILADIRRRAAPLAGVTVEPPKPHAGPPVGKPVQLQITSAVPALIGPTAARIAEAMAELGGFVDIEDGRPIPGIEWELMIDSAEAAKFGAYVTLIGNYVRMITNGTKLAEYRPDGSDKEIDIVVRLPAAFRNIEQLDSIRVHTDLGLVPISNFVSREARPKIGILRRVGGRRS